jgi:hypothetical protein
MSNPIYQAEQLKEGLLRVIDEVQMVPRWKGAIQDMITQVNTMIQTLTDIHSNIVPLDLSESAKQHASSLEFYRSLPGGSIQKGQPEYERLFTQSATLRELYQAGFDMPGMRKFGDDELSFAKEIGDGFQQWHEAWYGFMRSEQSQERFRQPRAEYGRQWGSFLEMLKKWEVISDYKSMYKDWRRKAFAKAKMNWILKLDRNNVLRFEWEKEKNKFDHLISGHWFSAFAYSIIVDHLDRLALDYEIYTLVRYSAPRDVIRSSGDLDVVVRTGEKILMIECKSGILRHVEERDDFAEIAEKAEALRKVFLHAHSDIDDYSFWLIYNPYLNKPEDVELQLADRGIDAVKPDDIRGEVRRCFEAK